MYKVYYDGDDFQESSVIEIGKILKGIWKYGEYEGMDFFENGISYKYQMTDIPRLVEMREYIKRGFREKETRTTVKMSQEHKEKPIKKLEHIPLSSIT